MTIRKFDVVVMNPPYQANSKDGGQKGTRTHIWHKFVKKAFSIVKEDGFICSINPGGWRRPAGNFKEIGDEMMMRQIHYLEIHNISDGQKTFGVTTGYDWFVLQNAKNTKKTIVIDANDVKSEIDLSNMKAIPNGLIEEITSLFAEQGEEKVNFIFDGTTYDHRKQWMNKEKNEEFKYPVVYSLPQKGIQLLYSSKKSNGHFGIPKIIWSNGAATQILIDEKGEYGMTVWAYAIADEPSVLPMIKKAMESQKFLDLCKGMRFTLDKYDSKFISLFRKDFWKEFIDENGNEKA
jgi:hypothetical protein